MLGAVINGGEGITIRFLSAMVADHLFRQCNIYVVLGARLGYGFENARNGLIDLLKSTYSCRSICLNEPGHSIFDWRILN